MKRVVFIPDKHKALENVKKTVKEVMLYLLHSIGLVQKFMQFVQLF